MRHRAVLDTNVLVSGLLGGATTEVLRQFRNGVFDLILSQPILAEYETVLHRPKFKLPRWVAEEMLGYTCDHALWVEPVEPLQPITRDPSDDKFLQAAIHGNAGWVVSGDQDLLHSEPIKGIQVVSPREFLSILKKG